MRQELGLIVGMNHHKGAATALMYLQDGAPLSLVRDRHNRYDANAIQVWVSTGPFTGEQLSSLRAQGASFAAPGGTMMLGFIARQDAARIAPMLDANPNVGVNLTGAKARIFWAE